MKALIRAVLEQRLAAWATAQSPTVAVAWEGTDSTPEIGKPYLQSWLMPATTQNPNVDLLRRRYRGYFQVSVMGPADGKGTGAVTALSSAIAEIYPIGLKLTIGNDYLRVDRIPDVSATRVDGEFLRDDVTVFYEFDTSNF